MSVLQNFQTWKQFLAERLQAAKAAGMSEGEITTLVTHVGNFLQAEVDPENVEERLLADLWSVADDREKVAFVQLMMKYVEQK